MSALRTRKPTGQVAYPTILLDGPEKSGKSYCAYRLSASPKVGRTFVFDLGEGTADEYAELGPYEVVEHNGTFTDLLEQMRAAAAVPAVDGKPNVIVLDDGSALWNLLKDWAAARARGSKSAREKLAKDPDAEIDVSMNYWNDAKDRWAAVLNLLRAFPGIGVILARGKEVAKVKDGKPVAGQTEWSTEAEKSTGFAVSAIVRMSYPHTATLVGVRSLHVDLPRNGQVLPEDNPLESLVFDVLGGGFAPSTRVIPSLGIERGEAKGRLVDLIQSRGLDRDKATALAKELWPMTGDPPEVTPDQWAALEAAVAARFAIPDNPEFDVDNEPLASLALFAELTPKVKALVDPTSKAKAGTALRSLIPALKRLGVETDDDQRAVLSTLVGREVHSRADLTASEAAAVVAVLDEEGAG